MQFELHGSWKEEWKQNLKRSWRKNGSKISIQRFHKQGSAHKGISLYVICFASCLLQGNCSIWVFGKLLWVGFLWPSRPCIVVLISMLVWYLGMLPWVSCWISVRVLWSIFSCGNEIPWIIHPKKKKKKEKGNPFFWKYDLETKGAKYNFFFFFWLNNLTVPARNTQM